MKTEIVKLCKTLKIGTIIADEYQNIEANTKEEFLLKILTEAVKDREVKRKNRLLKQANFDVLKTFENYSFEDVQIPEKLQHENLKNGDFVKNKENLKVQICCNNQTSFFIAICYYLKQ